MKIQTKQISQPKPQLEESSLNTLIRREWLDKGYGGLKERIILNPDGSRSNVLAIEKHSRIVNCMSTAYHVLPNYDVTEMLQPLMDELGLIPFAPKNRIHGNWTKVNTGSAIYDDLETEMLSSYIFKDKEFDITGLKDMVKPGLTIRNSEAGKYAFSITPFTHRNSCDNRMYHLAHETTLGADLIIKRTEALEQQRDLIAEAKKAYSETVRGFKKTHSASLNLEYVKAALKYVELGADNVINRYKEMHAMKVLQHQAESIVSRFPKYIIDELSWITTSEDKKTKEVKVKLDDDTNQWEAFNDITKVLTHKGKSFNPTLNQYKQLDEILVKTDGGQLVV